MKNSIRVSAKTVDDAITEAIIQLGVTSDQLEYEVIEKGSAGFLGIGMKQAVIEVNRKDGRVSSEEKREKIKFDFKTEGKSKDESLKKSEKGKDFQKTKSEPEPRKADKGKEDEAIKDKTSKESGSKGSASNTSASNESVFKAETPPEGAYKESIPPEGDSNENISRDSVLRENQEKEVVAVEITETTKAEVEKFLTETLKAMSLEVKVAVLVDEDNTLCVEIEGENMGIIIGKRGQTLDSLQYLANRVANKYQSEYIRVKVDTENYRARRDETLTRLAKNLAHKVKRTRRPVSLEPMNPYERRIIHSVLQTNPHVKTHSEGDEPYRKVVITLKRY